MFDYEIFFQTVRNMIIWFDPKMANYTIDSEKEYGVNCWDITFERYLVFVSSVARKKAF